MSLMGRKLVDDASVYRIYTRVCKLWACAERHAQKLDGIELLALVVVGLWGSDRNSNLVLEPMLVHLFCGRLSMFNLE